MEEYFLNLSPVEFEELDASLEAICEENEKFTGSILYFLVTSLMNSQNIIVLCNNIIKNKKFDKDHNLKCGMAMNFDSIERIIPLNLINRNDTKITQVLKVVNKAEILFDDLINKKTKSISKNLKIQIILFKLLESWINQIILEDSLIEIYEKTPRDKHIDLVLFHMNIGTLSKEVALFFLEKFIYKSEELRAA